MASSQKDTSPNQGKKASGTKNDDGREGAKTGAKAPFNDKSVGEMPNEGAPELGGKGVIGDLV